MEKRNQMSAKVRIVLSVVVVIMTLSVFVFSANASHSWGNYHWARTSNPFTLQLGDNVNSSWDSYLVTTANDWSASSVLDTVIGSGQAKGRCRPTAGRVEVCNGSYGTNGWLGLAQIWLSGGHISQGAVKVNDTYFSLPQYNTPDERNHVMCQEVGHTLGLGHTSEDGSSQQTCMDYSQDPQSTHPNQHDYQMLEQIYAHLDSTSTIASMPAEMANGDFDAPGAWGRLVASNARSATYERDFGNGNKVYTFVYWAYK
jgi:hypothetical protein